MLMRKKLIVNQSRAGQWLTLLLALLLLPVGAQAEDYGITIAGIAVTDANAGGVVGDGITGTITYTASTNTLTLSGATVTGNTLSQGCIVTSRSALNIAVIGENTLDCSSDSCTTIRSTLENGGALTFLKGGDHCSLTLQGGNAIHDFASVTVSTGLYWDEAYTYEMGTTNFGSGMSLRNPMGETSYFTTEATNAVLSDAQPLGLTVGGVSVTTWNADNVFGDSHQSVSYDAENHLLTLKGAGFANGLTCDETITDLSFRLVGYNQLFGDFVVASPQATTLHFTTSTKLSGSLYLGGSDTSNLLECTIDYQNGLSYEDGVIQAELEDTEITSFTGRVSYINEETNYCYIYSSPMEFYASKAVSTYDQSKNYGVIVSTKESETSASMWSTNINASLLKKVLIQYDWGTNANKNVTVQIRGMRQNQQTYDYEFDDKVYSEAISLSTADADGIVEIPLNNTVTSETVQIYFSSNNAFSFMPLNFGFTNYQSYGIEVGGTSVTEMNVDDVLGDGKVSYDVENKVLTLSGATINGRIFCDALGENGLTVHLLGSNIINGGYQSEDFNGDYAFVIEGESVPLTFTTDEETPGQLLMKNTYRNEYGYAEYYNGFDSNPNLENGLTYTSNDEKRLIAFAPVMTPGEGLYWVDQQFSISGLSGATIYYSYVNEQNVYEAPFTLENAGRYNMSVWETITVDGTEFSLYANSGNAYFIHNKPTFSVAEGTYNDTQTLTLSNLPAGLAEDIENYPQVWYFLNDNKNDSIQYTAIAQEIALMESAKVCVYIIDQDSGKIFKSEPVEAQYTVIPKTELNISYAQNSREWASYYADEKSLETPAGLQANIVTEVTSTGVTVSPVDYIPQGVGILLKRTEDVEEPIMAKAYMEETPETQAEAVTNLLEGTAESKAISTISGNVYVLYNDGFTRAYKGSIPAHRSYLVLADQPAEARLWIWEDDEQTTAVGRVRGDSVATEGTLYNLNGQRVSKPTKGLYISDGKKRIVK